MTGHSGAAVLDRPRARMPSSWGRTRNLQGDLLSVAEPARASVLVVVAYHSETITEGFTPAKARAVLPANELVAQLRNGGLPIAAVAEILKVERKTIYAWLDGAYPNHGNAARIETLYALLGGDKFDLRNLYRVWNRKLERGGSIRDLLTADPLDERAIRDALELLRPAIAWHAEHAKRRRPPQRGAGYPVIDEMPEAASRRED